MFSKTSLGVVGAAAVGFIGYCIYFDHKRRSDPLFKQKLRERRKKAKTTSQKPKGVSGLSKLPDLNDHQAMQQFFLQEVQLGEELLASGNIDGGVEHLTNAVVVCGQPNQLLTVLQQTLPPQVYHLLEQRVPVVSQQIAASAFEKSLGPAMAGNISGLVEEDLE